MTVVLFCGGLGLRMREYAHDIPKPMAQIGSEPILHHLMKYYATYGHGHFVLCLGYQSEVVVRHFLRSRDRVANETLPDEAVRVHLRSHDFGRYTVDLVPTGHEASIGERLRAVRRYIAEDIFLANYADGLSDLDLPHFLARFTASGATAGLISVRSPSTLHLVNVGSSGFVEEVQVAAATDLRVNGGFFAMRKRIFDELVPGEDLVDGLFPRLAAGTSSCPARTWSTDCSPGSPPAAGSSATATKASGHAWTHPRTGTTWTTWMPTVTHRGRCGCATAPSQLPEHLRRNMPSSQATALRGHKARLEFP